MTITIKIENQRDFQWLEPFLDALKKNTNAQIEIESSESVAEKAWREKVNAFLHFTETNAIKVPKIEHLTRAELNER